jgi:hypothetical protein
MRKKTTALPGVGVTAQAEGRSDTIVIRPLTKIPQPVKPVIKPSRVVPPLTADPRLARGTAVPGGSSV